MKCREQRLEYWDARSEAAWVVRDVFLPHQKPCQRLARLTERIAAARGSPIETFGSTTVMVRDEQGKRLCALEADQIVYLNPRQDAPEDRLIEVGESILPDVVLEVDHTTDVRGGKLKLYEAWGFAEVWVEVPDTPPPPRAANAAARPV